MKRTSKISVLALALLLCMSVLLPACGSGAASSAGQDSSLQISVPKSPLKS